MPVPFNALIDRVEKGMDNEWSGVDDGVAGSLSVLLMTRITCLPLHREVMSLSSSSDGGVSMTHRTIAALERAE